MERRIGPSQKRSLSSSLSRSLKMLMYVANRRYPDEQISGFRAADLDKIRANALHSERPCASLEQLDTEFTKRMRERTYEYWPELWDSEDEGRALAVIRVMREYLRNFWRAKDEHARDWYIHRAREYYQRFMVQRGFRQQLREATTVGAYAALNVEMDRKLDDPPAETPFENALFELQERARKKSLAPRMCENAPGPLPSGTPDDQLPEKNEEKCLHPYFLRTKTKRNYCSPKCFHEGGKLKSERKSWHKHKKEWRKK